MAGSTTVLDKVSGYFFIIGFLFSKLRYIPLLFLSSILNIASLSAYLIGYGAWYIASLLYPNYPRKRTEWYGFSEFKEQYQLASLLGSLATIICIACPTYIIPALWLYTFSNIVWSISEYHKQQNPPPYDPNFSTARQTIYLRYALLTAGISAITALASTIAIAFPYVAFASLLISTIVGNGLTVWALYYWKKSTFDDYPPDSSVNHSYTQLADSLAFDLQDRPAETVIHQIQQPTQDESIAPVNQPTALFESEARSCCL